jgi:threonine dehydrogenase-like Zn-dependent dehydrogenase
VLNSLLKYFSDAGGLIGLVVIVLLLFVGIVTVTVLRISSRLIDLKREMYRAEILPDRRPANRNK